MTADDFKVLRVAGTMIAGPVRVPFSVAFRPPRAVFAGNGASEEIRRAIVPELPLDRLRLETNPDALDALMAMDRRTPVDFDIQRVTIEGGAAMSRKNPTRDGMHAKGANLAPFAARGRQTPRTATEVAETGPKRARTGLMPDRR